MPKRDPMSTTNPPLDQSLIDEASKLVDWDEDEVDEDGMWAKELYQKPKAEQEKVWRDLKAMFQRSQRRKKPRS